MVVLVKGADEARRYLQQRAIQTSKHYTPVSQLSLYADEAADRTSVADDLITLPLSSRMTSEQVEFVAGVLREFCDRQDGAAVVSHETVSI
jgi:dTDP-4-amino-4,6-dideoxygalactose transaminase